MYLETVEDVLSRSSKVLLDAEGSGNVIYLPLDRLLDGTMRATDRDTVRSGAAGATSTDSEDQPNRDGSRSRSRP
jgi:membrane protease subunit HflK